MRAAFAVVLFAVASTSSLHADTLACGGTDPCSRKSHPGEVSIILLGDTGYGEGGSSEWGPHSQGRVAQQLDRVCPRPDLVFFLGDNIYWKGTPERFGPRFDTMYKRLFDPEQRRVHTALGNHDVKGCRLADISAFGPGETCADALTRLVGTDAAQDAPAATGAAAAASAARASLLDDVLARARPVAEANCPPAQDIAYEQDQATGSVGACYATQALGHVAFGYGRQGETPLRYYTVDWPPVGIPSDSPAVRVLVSDSNTLDTEDHAQPDIVPQPQPQPQMEAEGRTDRLQLLWMENQLRTAPDFAWRFVLMHHPPYTPRGCVFKLMGCVGGHGDAPGLQRQLLSLYGGPPRTSATSPTFAAHRPDFVFTAHNHFYARSHALDAGGQRAQVPGDGVRYFVTGGGGAPLYRLQPLHSRYASAGAYHHYTHLRLRKDEAYFFAVDSTGKVRDSGCFRRGENVDRCIAAGTPSSDSLICGEPAPRAPLTCPAGR